jgi:MarR family transcriptional regulator, transcriptional regulator for hemolysin
METTEQFGHLIRETARLWRMHLNAHLAPTGLSYAKWSAMRLLTHHDEGIIQNDFAALLSIEGPTLARMLAALEADGWIGRTQSATDRRAKIVQFTAEGREKFDALQPIVTSLRNEVLSGIDEMQLQASITVFEHILDKFALIDEKK